MKILALFPLVILLLVPFIQANALNEITFSTDKNSYAQGEKIIITGSMIHFVVSEFANVNIIDPSGQIIFNTDYQVGTDKTYYADISTTDWTTSGNYTIIVKYLDSTVTKQIQFTSKTIKTHMSDLGYTNFLTKLEILKNQGLITVDDIQKANDYLISKGYITEDQRVSVSANVSDSEPVKKSIQRFRTQVLDCMEDPHDSNYVYLRVEIWNNDKYSHKMIIVSSVFDSANNTLSENTGDPHQLPANSDWMYQIELEVRQGFDHCGVFLKILN